MEVPPIQTLKSVVVFLWEGYSIKSKIYNDDIVCFFLLIILLTIRKMTVKALIEPEKRK